jgi:hypothetical protein
MVMSINDIDNFGEEQKIDIMSQGLSKLLKRVFILVFSNSHRRSKSSPAQFSSAAQSAESSDRQESIPSECLALSAF